MKPRDLIRAILEQDVALTIAADDLEFLQRWRACLERRLTEQSRGSIAGGPSHSPPGA